MRALRQSLFTIAAAMVGTLACMPNTLEDLEISCNEEACPPGFACVYGTCEQQCPDLRDQACLDMYRGDTDGASGGDSSADDTYIPSEDSSTGGSSASGCESVELDLDGVWITPEDATVDPNGSYAALELDAASKTGEVAQYAYGASQFTPISQWRVEGSDCDEIHWDYGTGWLSDYSVIHELSSSALELEATDGSYYGERSRYRREGSSGGTDGDTGPMDEPTGPVCGDYCSGSCDVGVCWETNDGNKCLPSSCTACFDAGLACEYQGGSECGFVGCV